MIAATPSSPSVRPPPLPTSSTVLLFSSSIGFRDAQSSIPAARGLAESPPDISRLSVPRLLQKRQASCDLYKYRGFPAASPGVFSQSYPQRGPTDRRAIAKRKPSDAEYVHAGRPPEGATVTHRTIIFLRPFDSSPAHRLLSLRAPISSSFSSLFCFLTLQRQPCLPTDPSWPTSSPPSAPTLPQPTKPPRHHHRPDRLVLRVYPRLPTSPQAHRQPPRQRQRQPPDR